MKTKTQSYYCKKCGTVSTIVDKQNGIALNEITSVFCPICGPKGHRHQMYKVEVDNIKLIKGGENK